MSSSKQDATTSLLSTIVGLVVLVAISYALIKVILALAAALGTVSLSSLDSTVAAAFIAGTITVTGVVIGQMFNRSREVKFENRKKQVEAYELFLESLFNFFKEKDDAKKQEYVEEKINFDFTKNVMLWSSNKTLKSYFQFKDYAKRYPSDEVGILGKLEDLILAIRVDLGHRRKFKRGELLSLMFDDTAEDIGRLITGNK